MMSFPRYSGERERLGDVRLRDVRDQTERLGDVRDQTSDI